MSDNSEVYSQIVPREEILRIRKQEILAEMLARERQEILQEILLTTGAKLTGTNLNNARDDEGRTILMLAALHGDTRAVKYLIHNGANPDAIDNYGNTALILASAGGNIKIVTFLLRHGVNVNAKNIDSKSALTYAVDYGHLEIADILRSYGANDSPSLFKRFFSWLFGD